MKHRSNIPDNHQCCLSLMKLSFPIYYFVYFPIKCLKEHKPVPIIWNNAFPWFWDSKLCIEFAWVEILAVLRYGDMTLDTVHYWVYSLLWEDFLSQIQATDWDTFSVLLLCLAFRNELVLLLVLLLLSLESLFTWKTLCL